METLDAWWITDDMQEPRRAAAVDRSHVMKGHAEMIIVCPRELVGCKWHL